MGRPLSAGDYFRPASNLKRSAKFVAMMSGWQSKRLTRMANGAARQRGTLNHKKGE
jgi:hypothetical protein